jgi:hypothetical protein
MLPGMATDAQITRLASDMECSNKLKTFKLKMAIRNSDDPVKEQSKVFLELLKAHPKFKNEEEDDSEKVLDMVSIIEDEPSMILVP